MKRCQVWRLGAHSRRPSWCRVMPMCECKTYYHACMPSRDAIWLDNRRSHAAMRSRWQVIAVRCRRWLRGGSCRLDATPRFFPQNMGTVPCGQPSRASCKKNRGETMRGERDIAVRSFKGRQIAGGGARRGEASNDKSCENSCRHRPPPAVRRGASLNGRRCIEFSYSISSRDNAVLDALDRFKPILS